MVGNYRTFYYCCYYYYNIWSPRHTSTRLHASIHRQWPRSRLAYIRPPWSWLLNVFYERALGTSKARARCYHHLHHHHQPDDHRLTVPILDATSSLLFLLHSLKNSIQLLQVFCSVKSFYSQRHTENYYFYNYFIIFFNLFSISNL